MKTRAVFCGPSKTGEDPQIESRVGELPIKSTWMTLALVVVLVGGCAFWLAGTGLPLARGGDLSGAPPAGPAGPSTPGGSFIPAGEPSADGVQPSGTDADGLDPQNREDKGEWSILVDLTQQRVYVRQGDELLRTMVCSTGTVDKPTPRGKFRIQNRGEWFFSKKYQQGGKWWVSFLNWGEYLFHSVPMDEQGRIIEEESRRLGQPASHGCVRLSLEDAKWVFDHVPVGTPVEIK